MSPPGISYVLVAVFLGYWIRLCHAGLPCEKSGYCSLEKVQPWSGDILHADALKAALAARSYRNELIIAPVSSGWIEQGAHLERQLATLGFAHLLFITNSSTDCASLLQFLPHVGCAWDSSPHHERGFEGATLLWFQRWKFTARAIRIGYNILALDLDVLVFSDPYIHLKQEPFINMTLLGNRENDCGLNGGFMYVQNAVPDGPVAWLFKETTFRPLRLMDDDFAHVKSWGSSPDLISDQPRLCHTFDQAWLDDVLSSTLIAAPFYKRLMRSCGGDKFWQQYEHIVDSDRRADCQGFVELPFFGVDERQPRYKSRSRWKHGPLRVPNITEAAWNKRLINMTLFPPKRGLYSEHFLKQLKEDCLACPPWRDDVMARLLEEGGMGDSLLANNSAAAAANTGGDSTAAAAAASTGGVAVAASGLPANVTVASEKSVIQDETLPHNGTLSQIGSEVMSATGSTNGTVESSGVATAGGNTTGLGRDVVEMFGFVPSWLFSAFVTSGMDGFWVTSPVTHEPPLQVMGHIHWFGGGCRWGCKISTAVMLLPSLNYTVAAMTRETKQAYLANEPVHRILALAPSVQLALMLRNIHDLHRVVGGMLQLATLSNRIVAWPSLPCNATWMSEKPHFMDDPKHYPLHLSEGLFPYNDPAFQPYFACFPSSMLHDACLDRSGMLPPEFWHWKAERNSSATAPGPNNTILAPDVETAGRLLSGAVSANSSMVVVNQTDVSEALSKVDGQAVVYLGWAVLVEDFDLQHPEFTIRADGCPGLHKHWTNHEGLMQLVTPGMPRAMLNNTTWTLVLTGSVVGT